MSFNIEERVFLPTGTGTNQGPSVFLGFESGFVWKKILFSCFLGKFLDGTSQE